MTNERARRIVVGVTGASGAVYAVRLVRGLVEAGAEAHVIVSPHGRRLLKDELGMTDVSPAGWLGQAHPNLILHDYRDVGDVLGSGSFLTDGMIICPCSTNTFAAVATGLGDNLIDRAAAVTLKERRRLILVLREMPLSHVDLLNAVRLSEAGAVICPASPGFYMLPTSIEDLVDFVAGKLMDLAGVDHTLTTRWADSPARRG